MSIIVKGENVLPFFLTTRKVTVMNEKYDSTQDTLDHMDKVWSISGDFIYRLMTAVDDHDKSKLSSPEKQLFDEWTPKLKSTTYGSDEYYAMLAKLKPALDHHYKHNSHHTEYHNDGISGMTLIDLVEMFCDWAAATKRHADGDLSKSIKINAERFKIDPQITSIFENTKKLMEL